jgi:anti-sigma28 factor (negative regulator of flagellin synthesis)
MISTPKQTPPQADSSDPIKALNNLLFNVPLTDEAKIQFIKEELSNGRYQIQSQSLAAKLMEHAHPELHVETEEIC